MIRKTILADAAFSAVEFEGVRRVFAAVAPSRGMTLAEQADSASATAREVLRHEGGAASIVMQTVFLKNRADEAECRKIIKGFYGQYLPATSYVFQPPCDGKLLSIETWGLVGESNDLQVEHVGEGMVIARHNGAAWGYLGDVQPETTEDATCARSLSAFCAADRRLKSAGWRFEEVVRTWLYLGDITGEEKQGSRYLELNRARTDFYRNMKFGDGLLPPHWNGTAYPASTGIGARGNSLSIGCIALRADRPDVAMIPLENPQQTSAYDYAHRYGVETPKFVRAMAVAAGDLITTFISGTASITASESRHDNNAARQTQQTLENIEALIAPDSFQRSGLSGPGATLGDLAIARVYIKRPDDYESVRAICRARLGDLPTIYVLADICRPELLVEVEAVAFSWR